MNFKLLHSIEELKRLMKKTLTKEILLRIQMVIMKAEGETIERMANFLSISKKIIITWLKKYLLEGLIGLKNIGQKVRETRLKNDEVLELKETIIEANKYDNNEKNHPELMARRSKPPLHKEE